MLFFKFLSGVKPFWDLEIISGKILLSLAERILVSILLIILYKLMGLKFFYFIVSIFLGIRVIEVDVISVGNILLLKKFITVFNRLCLMMF